MHYLVSDSNKKSTIKEETFNPLMLSGNKKVTHT